MWILHKSHTEEPRDELTKSHYEPGVIRDPCINRGLFPCGECPQCKIIDNGLHDLTIHGVHLRGNHFANCNTKSIIYLLVCKCKAYYIGKTKRRWRCRISEHSTDIKNSLVARHMACQHGSVPWLVRFMALDRVHPNIWGDWDKSTLRTESRWIFKLKAMKPPGLNILNSFKPFLDS